ncbi:MAG: oligosaccharide flippase family protein [Bacteroidota bacterium]
MKNKHETWFMLIFYKLKIVVMINGLKSKYLKHQALIHNFSFMSILQFSQMFFPLIIFPYLIRVLGKETYGIIAYSNAIIAYFLILINFGFNISEIHDISVNREDNQKLSEVISSVLILKSLLTILSVAILAIMVIYIPKLYEHRWLYLAYLGYLINGSLNTSFYFQGIEKMKFITYISVSANLIFLILTFIFVTDPSKYILVPLFTSLGLLLGAVMGLYIVFVKHKIIFFIPPIDTLKKHFKDSVPFFSSRASTSVMQKANYVLIGSFIGYQEVSYYDLAVKFVTVMKAPFNIFNQVLFPNVSKTKNFSLVLKTLRMLIVIYLVGYFSLFIFGEPLIKLVGGIELLPAKYVLYLLGITAITDLISVFMGAPLLLATGHKKQYNMSIIYGSLSFLFLVIVLYVLNWIGLYQLVAVTIISSLFVLIYRTYYCRKFKLI